MTAAGVKMTIKNALLVLLPFKALLCNAADCSNCESKQNDSFVQQLEQFFLQVILSLPPDFVSLSIYL